MIRTLPVKTFRTRFKTIRQWAASMKATGTWIAVSPTETIPENYKSRIDEDPDIRVLHEVPDNWRLINLCEEDNNYELVNRAKEDIYSIPGHNIIKEIISLDGFCWVVASKDLVYLPPCYYPELLEKNRWIEKGEWSLFCIGSAINRTEAKQKLLEYCQDRNIIFEEL